MDHWNYRVVVNSQDDLLGGDPSEWYSIIEAYYEGDQIVAWAEILPGGETVRDLEKDLRLMISAVAKPVVKREDLPGDNLRSPGLTAEEFAQKYLKPIMEGQG